MLWYLQGTQNVAFIKLQDIRSIRGFDMFSSKGKMSYTGIILSTATILIPCTLWLDSLTDIYTQSLEFMTCAFGSFNRFKIQTMIF